MEFESIGIVRFDFAQVSEKEPLHEFAGEFHHTSGESYQELNLIAGPPRDNIPYITKQSQIEGIDSHRTIIRQGSRPSTILDIVTIGTLDDTMTLRINEVQKENDELEAELSEIESELFDHLQDWPCWPSADSSTFWVFYPKQRQDIFGAEEIDISRIQDLYRDESDVFESCGFGVGYGRYISVLDEDLWIFQNSNIWGRALAIYQHNEASIVTQREPKWFTSLKMMIPFYRAFNWSLYRTTQLRQHDSILYSPEHLYEELEPLSSTEELSPEDYKYTLQKTESKLFELRRDWTEVYSKIMNEREEVRTSLESHHIPSEEIKRRHITPSKEGMIESKQTLLERLREDCDARISDIDSDISRIQDKYTQSTQFVNDAISLQEIAINVDLQSDIETLTRTLTTLTVVLVILTVLMLLASVLNLLMQYNVL